MRITDTDVQKFKVCLQGRFGRNFSNDEAYKLGLNLIEVFTLLSKAKGK